MDLNKNYINFCW